MIGIWIGKLKGANEGWQIAFGICIRLACRIGSLDADIERTGLRSAGGSDDRGVWGE